MNSYVSEIKFYGSEIKHFWGENTILRCIMHKMPRREQGMRWGTSIIAIVLIAIGADASRKLPPGEFQTEV